MTRAPSGTVHTSIEGKVSDGTVIQSGNFTGYLTLWLTAVRHRA